MEKNGEINGKWILQNFTKNAQSESFRFIEKAHLKMNGGIWDGYYMIRPEI